VFNWLRPNKKGRDPHPISSERNKRFAVFCETKKATHCAARIAARLSSIAQRL
jgi:hypothetical protein